MPQILDEWLAHHPVTPPQSRELQTWFKDQVNELNEQQPELCKWIRANPEATQLKLYGKKLPDPTAIRRRATQMGVLVPTVNHLFQP